MGIQPEQLGGETRPVRSIHLRTTNRMGSQDRVHDNMESACARGLPELDALVPAHDGRIAIAGGGPSLAETMWMLNNWSGEIFACNAAGTFLCDNGVMPHAVVFIDASPRMSQLVNPKLKSAKHYIGSACDPCVFDALEGYDVMVWHQFLAMPGLPKKKVMIGNGPMVGIRTCFLSLALGYRDIHLFGLDSSFKNGRDHAYYADMKSREPIILVEIKGRRFFTDQSFYRQAELIRNLVRHAARQGTRFTAYGDNLVSAMIAEDMGSPLTESTH